MARKYSLKTLRTLLSRTAAVEPDWRMEQMLPIVRADGSPVATFTSTAAWNDRKGERQISLDEMLTEEHHRAYGRPWIMGRLYYEELLRRGVTPTDRFLDIGCGSGRLGIYLIPYLEAQRYCGIESHLQSLVAFAAYEARLHDLFSRRPRLILDDAFSFAGFGETFDVAVDFYVTRHLGPDLTHLCYRNARATMRPGGRIFVLHPPSVGIDELKRIGFHLAHKETVHYRLPARARQDIRFSDEWHTFVAV